jgi:hypothetical protein
MALTQKEMENLQLEVLHQLSQTRYACHSMEIVSGGTTNFLFRSYLVQPSSDGQSTVIVKHSKPFVSGNRDFGLDISRSVGSPTLQCQLRHATDFVDIRGRDASRLEVFPYAATGELLSQNTASVLL